MTSDSSSGNGAVGAARSLSDSAVLDVARILERARVDAIAIPKVTDAFPGMTLADGYAVQRALRVRQIDDGRRRLVGFKMGLTSLAKMKQMGLATPVYGYLLDDFMVVQGETPIAGLIHPKVEPEIAFVLKSPLRGPGCHVGAVLAATAFVLPAMEIIDSRYQDYSFDLPSVIADNSSSARFVLGGRATDARNLDMRALGVVLEKNGAVVACGAAAAVMGSPVASVAALANLLHAQGEEIPAGAVILTGGITEAVSVRAGDCISLSIQSLGSASIGFR